MAKFGTESHSVSGERAFAATAASRCEGSILVSAINLRTAGQLAKSSPEALGQLVSSTQLPPLQR